MNNTSSTKPSHNMVNNPTSNHLSTVSGYQPPYLHRLWKNPQPISASDKTFHKPKYRYHWMDPLSLYPLTRITGENENEEMIFLPSVEHYFHFMRFAGHKNIQKKILAEPSPYRCRVMANSLQTALNLTTMEEMINNDIRCMSTAIFALVAEHGLEYKLKATRGCVLIYDCTDREYDLARFWGAVNDGSHWVGENVVGCLWMQHRDGLAI